MVKIWYRILVESFFLEKWKNESLESKGSVSKLHKRTGKCLFLNAILTGGDVE
jgi:hypothetical protein